MNDGYRRKQHGSVERVLNLAQMAKGDGMPQSLRQQFQRQLDKEQFEIEQLLNWLVSGDFSEAELLYNFHNSMSTEKIKLPDDYYTNLKKSFENSDRI